MRVDVGDIELYVHERGDGSPIVALHGGPGLDGSVWFPALDALAEDGFRILAVDHRGNAVPTPAIPRSGPSPGWPTTSRPSSRAWGWKTPS